MHVDLTVWAHDPADSQVYVDPSLIPGAAEGDIAELKCLKPEPKQTRGSTIRPGLNGHRPKSSRDYRKSAAMGSEKRKDKSELRNLYFLITKPKQTATKQTLPTISVSSNVLNALGIRPRSQVRVKLLKSEDDFRKVHLDVVEIHFRGVNLTRNDHYKIAKAISGKCVNCGQKVGYLNNSVRLTIDTLFRGGKRKFSGFIGEDTRLVFRSDSARVLIFIQMSSEMWNFDESGDIMFHSLVNNFIPEMLHRWHTQGDSHIVSIVLFTSVSARNYRAATNKQVLGAGMLEQQSFHFYRVVVDSVHISRWSDIMRTLRSEFERFPQEVLEDPETHELLGDFLPSYKSNILEAFSLATTLLTSKFVDRDLCRTGVQAMVATAGPACFDVDLSELWHLSRRLLGVEIGIELVCLARPPLHVTPLFRALLPATEDDEDTFELSQTQEHARLVFCVPTWINMSFWVSSDKYMKQWIPRCRIYDLQMVGLVEKESHTLGLKSFQFEANDLTHSYMKAFDASVFKSVDMIESQKRVEAAAKSANSAELRPRSETLYRGTPASAITTIAVAMPEATTPISSRAQSREPTPAPQEHVVSRPASPPPHHVQASASPAPAPAPAPKVAVSTLGALLGNSRNKAKNVKPVQSQLSLRLASRANAPAVTPANVHSDTAATDSRTSRTSDHSEPTTGHSTILSGVSETTRGKGHELPVPIYITTSAHKTKPKPSRRDSRLSRNHPQFSPSNNKHSYSTSSPKSPNRKMYHTRRGSSFAASSSINSGGDHDRSFHLVGSGSPPSIANNWKNSMNNMCDTSRPELQNPSMWRVLPNSGTIDNPSRVAAYGRWANVYPPMRRTNGVSWHSLKSPASLPLTSESFPSLVSFREHYKFQFYDVAVEGEEMPLALLLDEMIGLRLQLGFQIAVGPSVRAVEASLPRGNPNSVSIIVPRDPKECIGIRIYLTRTGLVHRLAVDDENTVNVRLYTWIDRNAQWLKSPQAGERKEDVKVKSRYALEYKAINKQFLDQGFEHLNWSMLDQQLSGSDDPLLYPSSANTQNLVTIRYVLLPVNAARIPGLESLTMEEGHVEGITRVVRLLLRNREAGSIDSDFIVHFYTGKLSESIGEVVQASNSPLKMNRLNKQISLKDLAAEMQGAMGLTFRDRRWHWKQFTHVFTGHDFVIWIMRTFDDISTVEEAEAYGTEVMRRGLIRHPENRHPFIFGHYFYQLTPEYDQHTARSSEEPTNLQEKANSGTAASPGEAPGGGGTNKGSGRAKVHVSESFVLNVDPRGISGRPERVKISIDRMHNPKNAFHLLVEWLSVTPKLVDDLFSNAGRFASQYGLRLVQVPVADVHGSLEDSPFRSAIRVKPNIKLDGPDEMRWFCHYLLRRNGYVLDVYDRKDIANDDYEVQFFWGRLRSSYPQYIHNSGFVLVQIENNDQLCITANTLHLSRAVLVGNAAAANADSECETLMNDLYHLCQDGKKMEELLVDGRKHRQQAKPSSIITTTQTRVADTPSQQ